MGDKPLTALPTAWLHDVTLPVIILPHATFLAGARFGRSEAVSWGGVGVLEVDWQRRGERSRTPFIAVPSSERARDGALTRLG
jgi:hypothetical protein